MSVTTKSALASELGITRGRVSQYVSAGMPTLADGKLDREAALPGLFNALSERDVADSAVRDVFSLSEGKPV